MTLQDIFDALTYGELSQLSIGGEEPGVITEDTYARVLNHVSLGIKALFTRFTLKEGRLVLQPVADQVVYSIDSKYAVANTRSAEAVRYLIDTVAAPFKDDIIKIEQVLTDTGYVLPLNDGADKFSVTTPSLTTLRFPLDLINQTSDMPDEYETGTYEIVYRAHHPKISLGPGFTDPSRVILQLPETHMQALLYFVASRVNNPVGMSQEFNAGNTWYAKYEGECAMLEGKNVQVDTGRQMNRIERGGWA